MGYIQKRFMEITFSGRQDLFQQNTHYRAETPDHADPGHAEMNNPPWGTPSPISLIDILPFVLSEELWQSQGAIAGQALGQVYSRGNEMQPN